LELAFKNSAILFSTYYPLLYRLSYLGNDTRWFFCRAFEQYKATAHVKIFSKEQWEAKKAKYDKIIKKYNP